MEFNWRNIAEAAYEAYTESLAKSGIVVEETFKGLSKDEQDAWIAAARMACDLFGRAVMA